MSGILLKALGQNKELFPHVELIDTSPLVLGKVTKAKNPKNITEWHTIIDNGNVFFWKCILKSIIDNIMQL